VAISNSLKEEEEMRRAVIAILVCLLSLTVAASLFAGGKQEKQAAPAMAEKATIRMHWWGEAEAPGMAQWVQETAQLYEKEHPEVTVEPHEIPIEDIYLTWKAAVAAGDPPDIQNLSPQEGLDEAAAGNVVPIDQFWSEAEVNHLLPPARRELSWSGRTWLVPLYMDAWLMAYNKKVFATAGVDPASPPTTWDGFVAALKKIKASGNIPFSIGFQDGYMGVWWACLFGYQAFNDMSDLHDAVIGKTKFTDPIHVAWWQQMDTLNRQGLFNDDCGSLGMVEGNDKFLAGNVGMVFVVQPMMAAYVRQLGEATVGAMLTPMPPNPGKLAGTMPVPSMPIGLAKASKHPEVAADFIRYMYKPERITAMYLVSGAMQASDQLDAKLIKSESDKQIAKWAVSIPGPTYNWHYSPQIESEVWASSQLLAIKEITGEEAASRMEAAAEQWRKDNPDSLERFKKRAEEWKATAP
jgi:raffinose/stachyose/melibiose transport system substrate-binding protein